MHTRASGDMNTRLIVYKKSLFLISDRVWCMGFDIIIENENYKHLCVNTNKYKISIKDATDRLKGTFLSLVHSGVLHHSHTCI